MSLGSKASRSDHRGMNTRLTCTRAAETAVAGRVMQLRGSKPCGQQVIVRLKWAMTDGAGSWGTRTNDTRGDAAHQQLNHSLLRFRWSDGQGMGMERHRMREGNCSLDVLRRAGWLLQARQLWKPPRPAWLSNQVPGCADHLAEEREMLTAHLPLLAELTGSPSTAERWNFSRKRRRVCVVTAR